MQIQTDRNPIRTELKNCIGIMVVVLRVHNFSSFKVLIFFNFSLPLLPSPSLIMISVIQNRKKNKNLFSVNELSGKGRRGRTYILEFNLIKFSNCCRVQYR